MRWETLYWLCTNWERLRQIKWVPHSNRNVQETSNGRYGQVISLNLVDGLWQGKLRVVHGDTLVVLIIDRCLSLARIIDYLQRNLTKNGQQTFGPNLWFVCFLACSMCSCIQCARQLNRYVQILSGFLRIFLSVQWVIIVGRNQSTGT